MGTVAQPTEVEKQAARWIPLLQAAGPHSMGLGFVIAAILLISSPVRVTWAPVNPSVHLSQINAEQSADGADVLLTYATRPINDGAVESVRVFARHGATGTTRRLTAATATVGAESTVLRFASSSLPEAGHAEKRWHITVEYVLVGEGGRRTVQSGELWQWVALP